MTQLTWVVESSTEPLELKIAFIVDPKKAAQSAQLKSLLVPSGRNGVWDKVENRQQNLRINPWKVTHLAEQSQRPVAGAVVLLRVVAGAVAHQCHIQVGFLLGAKGDVDCLLFFWVMVLDCSWPAWWPASTCKWVSSVYTSFQSLNKKFSILHFLSIYSYRCPCYWLHYTAKKTRKSQYKKKASKSARMASNREKNMQYIKEAQARQEEKQKKKKNMIKLKKRPLKMQNKVNERNEKNAESDPLDVYQAGHRMTVCARLQA